MKKDFISGRTSNRVITATLAAILLIPALSACRTMEGLSESVNNTFSNQSDGQQPIDSADILAAHAGETSASGVRIDSPCPEVQIVDELSSISEFSPPSAAFAENLISRADLYHAESFCTFQDKLAVVDLKLVFDASLGPQGRAGGNKNFFSYPFFIAVTDQNNVVLAKEVFSASMNFETGQATHRYHENLRQLVPIRSREQARRFKILLGFQLSPEQLAYNRANMRPVEELQAALETPTQDQSMSAAATVAPDYSELKADVQNTDTPINVVPQETEED
ncbi:MAG: hypothetical protein ACK4VI_07835 [Alphaproteobacteria bacterium]